MKFTYQFNFNKIKFTVRFSSTSIIPQNIENIQNNKNNNNNNNNKNYNNNKNNLPNNHKLVKLFLNFYNYNIKYCMNYKIFYLYQNNFWSSIDKDDLEDLFLDFLEIKFTNDFESFNTDNSNKIFKLIRKNSKFSLPDAIEIANENGFLLPFKNGILNSYTLELLNHSPDYFNTYVIPLDYSKEDSIENTKFVYFLNSITNYNPIRLKVLRACLYAIFTNNLSYQKGLYLYGPGGAGKSTLMDILTFIFSKEGALESSLTEITGRFDKISLLGKILLVLEDIPLYRGQEPATIKKIITQNKIKGEEKFNKSFRFTPTCWLIITSNILWEIKNPTTGLTRRIIYFPFDNIPTTIERNLFKKLSKYKAIGTLAPFLIGFINWVLKCPKEDLEILDLDGSKITEMICPDLIQVNPLNEFVKDCLIQDENSIVRIGNKDTNYESLYGTYLLWATNNGINIISLIQFSILLSDLLKQKGWQTKKTRITIGHIIKGIKLNKTLITDMKNSKFINLKKNLEINNDLTT